MYGWRGRVGLIVPASNLTCEREMAKMCPSGVVTFATRIFFEPTVSGLRQMGHSVERAASELSCEGISDVIAFCCTVGSMVEGPGHDARIMSLIKDTAGTPATTTTTGVVEALRYLGVQRLSIATPYTADVNTVEKSIMEALGFSVMRIESVFAHVAPEDFRNTMIERCTTSDVYRLAREVDCPEADAILISCTNFPAIDVIESLERDLGKPVISSNQATMWSALRLLGIEGEVEGYGRLLRSTA